MRKCRTIAVMLAAGLLASCASPAEPGNRPALRVLAYPVNRVLDLTDVVSFSAGVYVLDPLYLVEHGHSKWNSLLVALVLPGLGIEAHATRAVQLGFTSVWGPEVGWWPGRELGVGTRRTSAFAFGPWSEENTARTRWTTRGATYVEQCWGEWNRGNPAGLEFDAPADPRHQGYERDYWGIGFSAYYLAGASLEVHPAEIADLVCGLLFIDFMWDDIGHQRTQ